MAADEQSPEPVLDVALPPQEMIGVELVPRQVMHGARRDRLVGRVSLGVPHVKALDSDALADLGLRHHEGGEDRAYCLLAFAVNFAVNHPDPVLDATVGVVLRNDTAPGSAPVARSLDPLRLARARARTSTIGISAKLGIVEPQVSRGVTDSGGEPFLIADGLGSHEPAWSFRANHHQDLVGPYQLLMVVESPRGAKTSALLALAATVRHSVLGVISYRAEVPPDLALVPLTA
ncbi:hypothetical protein GCM10010174_65860 [Kutzneria viridogrisea]|uniref:Uncharacterized protein n=1 Tax=Kutzneria viridogrisea TaxID=47990 RepID=A0ABR6BYA5_9PSEU|nr:hypothetical protein [Kutzneria viridogrisea]